jgi:tetratricopeptide (TPR) repeat protein
LSNLPQPCIEVVELISELLNEPEKVGLRFFQNESRVFEHVASFAEFQFGDRIPGSSFRYTIPNGVKISNWDYEMGIYYQIFVRLCYICSDNESLSQIVKYNMMMPYLERRLQILMPWLHLIDSNDTTSRNVLNRDQINQILDCSSSTERLMGCIYIQRNEMSKAEDYCQRALAHARRYEGDSENKADQLSRALRQFYDLRKNQGNKTVAFMFAEEAYNCVAEAYNPVHPEVQEAAGTLIECLIYKGDLVSLEQAQTFALMTLDSLKDPGNGLDQNSVEVAQGYYNLGHVLYEQDVDLVKALELAREAYRIRVLLYGKDHFLVGVGTSLLVRILRQQKNLGDERKKLCELFLANTIVNGGSNGINYGVANTFLCDYYLDLAAQEVAVNTIVKEYFCKAEPYCKEVVRIFKNIYGVTNAETMKYTKLLSTILLQPSGM